MSTLLLCLRRSPFRVCFLIEPTTQHYYGVITQNDSKDQISSEELDYQTQPEQIAMAIYIDS